MASWPDHSPSGNQKRFWRDFECKERILSPVHLPNSACAGIFIHSFIHSWKILGIIGVSREITPIWRFTKR